MNSKEEQFRTIYVTYKPMIHAVAKKKGIPEDEIEDLVQDTFEAYYKHYPVDWPDYKVRAALVKIIRNRCVDYYRSRGARPVTYYDPVLIQDVSFSAENFISRDSLTILLEHQEYKEVIEIIKSMKPEWAAVFILHVIEGRPMAEVSEIMGLRPDACRARLCRGRNYLRKCLCPEEPEKYRPTAKGRTSPLPRIPKVREIPEGT